MLEGDSAPRKFLDPFVEVVAFEVDGGRRHDSLVRIDLHGQGDSTSSFEAGVARVRAIDDLLQAEPAIEVGRTLVIGSGDRDLVEPRTRTDVEPHTSVAHRPGAVPEFGCVVQRDANELASTRDRVGEARSLRKEQCDGAGKGAAGAVRTRRVDPLTLPARHIVGLDQRIRERFTLFVPSLDQHRAPVFPDQVQCGRNRVVL